MTEIMVVVDANVVVALVDDRDRWYSTAVALRDALVSVGVRLVYLDCVVNEAISVIGRRTEEQQRSDQFERLLDKLTAAVPTENVTWIAQDSQRLFSHILELC